MKTALLSLLLCALAWGDFFLLDDGKAVKLAPLEGPKCSEAVLASLPRIKRKEPTLTLLYRGDAYNHRHINVRTETLQKHPVHTVLDEHSKRLDDGSYRITFDNYTFTEALMLQVFYKGAWYAIMLDALDQQ